MFVGWIPQLAKGYWVGVKLDEPSGESNGSIDGVKYFEAQEKQGLFVWPKELSVGDYPEVDPFGGDDEI